MKFIKTVDSVGHIIKEEDIPLLLSLGKENVYIWGNQAGMVHAPWSLGRVK